MTTAHERAADDSLVKGIAGSQFLIHILLAKTLRVIKVGAPTSISFTVIQDRAVDTKTIAFFRRSSLRHVPR